MVMILLVRSTQHPPNCVIFSFWEYNALKLWKKEAIRPAHHTDNNQTYGTVDQKQAYFSVELLIVKILIHCATKSSMPIDTGLHGL